MERYIFESKSSNSLENLCLLVFKDNKSTDTPFDIKELARERIAIDSPSFDGKGTFLVNCRTRIAGETPNFKIYLAFAGLFQTLFILSISAMRSEGSIAILKMSSSFTGKFKEY